MKRAVRLTSLATALALLVLLPAAQAQDAKRAFAEGSHVFRRILFEAECTPLKDFNDLGDDPAHTLLIVLGDTHCLTQLTMSLPRFVQQGGALLLASDQPVQDVEVRRQLLTVAGVEILGQPRQVGVVNKDTCYHGLDFCPYAQPVRRTNPGLFFDAHGQPFHVATNVPAVLDDPIQNSPPLGHVKRLAMLPAGFGHKLFRIGGLLGLEQNLFAVGGDVGDGRVLVLADHSAFINEMMLPSDNDNVEFTTNCVSWLSGDEKQRTKVLFVENGQIRDSFDIPLRYETLPLDKALAMFVGAADKQLEQFNERLAEPEGQSFANAFIHQWLESKNLMESFGEVVIIALTVALLLLGCYRMGVKGRYRNDLNVPLLTRLLEQETPRRPLAEQRHEALLRSGNLWESARGLARQCFVAHAASQAAPRIVAQGGWWQRWRTRRRVSRLWHLAWSERPVRVPPRRFKSLLAEIEQLKAELRDGTVRLEPSPSFSREPPASALAARSPEARG
jgi:hypothetical protein